MQRGSNTIIHIEQRQNRDLYFMDSVAPVFAMCMCARARRGIRLKSSASHSAKIVLSTCGAWTEDGMVCVNKILFGSLLKAYRGFSIDRRASKSDDDVNAYSRAFVRNTSIYAHFELLICVYHVAVMT